MDKGKPAYLSLLTTPGNVMLVERFTVPNVGIKPVVIP